MAINGPGPIQNAFPVKPATSTPQVQQPAETRAVSPRDEVEISSAGKMLDQINQSGELRAERLAQIKAAIDADEYDTPEKLELALSRMIAEIETQDVSNG